MTGPAFELPQERQMAYRIRALIARHRYMTNTVMAELQAMLKDAHRRAAIEVLSGVLGSTARSRVQALGASAAAMLAEAYPRASERAFTHLAAYAAVEREAAMVQVFGAGALSPELAVELAALPEAVLDIGINGYGFGEWWLHSAQDAIYRMRRELQYGLAKGEHPDAIARRIYTGKIAKRGDTGGTVWKGSRASLRMAVRAVATAVQNRAFLAAIDNSGGVKYLMLDVVQDARTSVICLAIKQQAKVYKSTDPTMPIPPLHPHCRTGIKQVRDEHGDESESPEAFLKRQSRETQDDILGPGRAELWRTSRLSLVDLIDADNRPLTLAQLRKVLVDL